MTDSVAADQLQSFVRRIESVEDEINALNSDKSEIYKEAKSDGFDVKVLRKLIADRRKDASERAEFETIYELYAAALGMRLYRAEDAVPASLRAHVENIDEFDADGVLIEQQPPQPAASDLTVPPPSGQVATIQPETANDPRSMEPALEQALSGSQTDLIDPSSGQRDPEVRGLGEGASPQADKSGEVAALTSPAPLEFKPRKLLRPLCQKRDRCSASGPKECYSCLKAAAQAGAA